MTQVLSVPRRKKPARRREAGSPLNGIQHFVLENATWELYDQLLREIGDRPIRINYDQGRLEMMSPLPEHEEVKGIIGRLIKELTIALGMEIESLGSTTFRREDKAKGLEPDECFYFKNEKKMRGRKRLNLKKDPPPELVVEVDITHRSGPRGDLRRSGRAGNLALGRHEAGMPRTRRRRLPLAVQEPCLLLSRARRADPLYPHAHSRRRKRDRSEVPGVGTSQRLGALITGRRLLRSRIPPR